MQNLYITSLSKGSGKTAICAGIGKQLQNHGKKVIGEFEFDGCAYAGLLHDVRRPAVLHQAVVYVEIAVNEDAIHGDFDVVEDHERVLFVKPA